MAKPGQGSRPHFGDALVGSVLGTAVGGTLGVLMIRGAADDAVWEEQEKRITNDCCVLQRIGFGLIGVVFAAGAGPYGAAERLDRGGVPVYGAAVSGQVLLGGLGYALGSTLGGEDGSLLGGLAVGLPLAAIGAAGGAVLGARESYAMERAGGVRFRGGEWQVGMPDLRIRPNLRTERGPVVHISLFSAQID